MPYIISDYLGEDINYLFSNSSNNDIHDNDANYYVSYEDSQYQEYEQEEEYRISNEMTNGGQVKYLRSKRYEANEPFDPDDYEYIQENYNDDIRGDGSDYF